MDACIATTHSCPSHRDRHRACIPPIALLAVLATLVWSGLCWVTVGLVADCRRGVRGSACGLVLAHGWAEREDDLLIKRGRLWRSVTVVPYGRMQYVEVTSGPHHPGFRHRDRAVAHRIAGDRCVIRVGFPRTMRRG